MRNLLLAPLSAALLLTLGAPAASAADAPKIQRLPTVSDAAAEAGRYPPEMVVKGQGAFDGSFKDSAVFKDANGVTRVHIWESGPGVLQTDGYPYDEYCLVLEGRLEVTNAAGGRESFGPGDTFVIPKGWRGLWDMKTRFRKQFVALTEPDSAPAK